ncbi:MAG: type II toxin-antitoxin system VapC family toxin [Actinomycetota bacterium]|nr:type II toxin-antitoxin system VapC family toxin [Actinomycetota bacterium]
MSPGVTVVDASALLALLFDEPGAHVVAEMIASGASVSTVNFAEVATVLTRNDRDAETLLESVRAQVDVEPFSYADALEVAALYPRVSGHGLSLGDRACLALARRLDVPAVTAEHVWAELWVDVRVQLIRPGRRPGR